MRIISRPFAAASIVTTRNPDSPRIHVQSPRDPTRPPLLVAHQERTPSKFRMAKWDRVASNGNRGRPAITAIAVPRGPGVKAGARRGRVLCGALTPGNTGRRSSSPAVPQDGEIAVLKSAKSRFSETATSCRWVAYESRQTHTDLHRQSATARRQTPTRTTANVRVVMSATDRGEARRRAHDNTIDASTPRHRTSNGRRVCSAIGGQQERSERSGTGPRRKVQQIPSPEPKAGQLQNA